MFLELISTSKLAFRPWSVSLIAYFLANIFHSTIDGSFVENSWTTNMTFIIPRIYLFSSSTHLFRGNSCFFNKKEQIHNYQGRWHLSIITSQKIKRKSFSFFCIQGRTLWLEQQNLCKWKIIDFLVVCLKWRRILHIFCSLSLSFYYISTNVLFRSHEVKTHFVCSPLLLFLKCSTLFFFVFKFFVTSQIYRPFFL